MVGAGPVGSRRSRACWPPTPTSRGRAARAARGRRARARGLADARRCASTAATTSTASSWSSPRPRTPSSTCGSSATPTRGRCSSTSSTCRRSATSSCRRSCASGRSRSPSPPGRQPGAGQAPEQREIAERYGEPYARARGAPQRHPRLGQGDASDLPGAQGLLRGHRERQPDPSRSCARATSRPCATSSRHACAPSRAPVPLPDAASRGSSRASPSARSARPFRMFREADPALECADGAGAPPRQRRGLPGRARRPRAAAARRRGDGLRGRPLHRASRSPRSARCTAGARRTRPRASAPRAGPSSRGRSSTARSRRSGIEAETVLWNVVPAHPHRPGEPLSNRTPAVGELRAGAEVLGELIERLRPRALVAVGRSAERALGELGLTATPCVRHPANGGATAFRAGLGAWRCDQGPRAARLSRALMVARVPDRRAQRERAQHQHEGECRRAARSRPPRRPACRPRTRAAGRRSPRR